jgi:hypothetical protein
MINSCSDLVTLLERIWSKMLQPEGLFGVPTGAVIRSFVILPHTPAPWGSGPAANSVCDQSITFSDCRWRGVDVSVGSVELRRLPHLLGSFSDPGGVMD